MIKEKCIIGFLYLFAYLPWSAIHATGWLISYLLFHFNGRERRNTAINIKIAYPTFSPQKRSHLIQQSLYATALTYVEIPRIWLRPETLKNRIEPNGVGEVIDTLLQKNNGLIFAIPHLGNWEMISTAINLSRPSLPITALYRPPRQAFLEPLLKRGRTQYNIKVAPTSRTGLKALSQTLKHHEIIAILPDQIPKSAGSAAIAAPFFGHDVLTMTLLNRLAAKHQSPVLFLWAERLPDRRYRLQYFIGNTQNANPDTKTAATAMNQDIERCITSHPEQYQWVYRRFEPVDPTQPNPYHRPAK
jgi:KDO2-lipid IV(A) lauroyltransferase